MVRIPVRILFLFLLFASPALAQSNWLHPSDKEYQYAIDAVFDKAKAGDGDAPTLQYIQRLADGTNSYISVRPPLACASLRAEAQKQAAGWPPSIAEIKQQCDGQLLVAVRYFSAPSELDRSLVIEHGDQEIKPLRSFYDRAHPVVALGESTLQAQVQYAYMDLHFVVPDAAWEDDVRFVATDANGGQSKLTFDFSSQAKNERLIDSESK